ncbi:uncharacterized protein SCODWIG_01872 [Saccharomycodes ludwigii]|uniref:Homeobox domain-containing protein n=1 Tax=Saccharomycodes ludwigii TaxID=36035 RepID=A0A376B647_9ASCO|nr:hypothetical protein SCDLUD_001049 [Saccharomycodes ludwigii]KAH3903413.1 hypothetical protein SCDLUD_001049 [Saccharomycodes ludwigii]SSD60111.1 uncharacterized protein SCODWIG_01872 [Saccharomycodes ludwigii]
MEYRDINNNTNCIITNSNSCVRLPSINLLLSTLERGENNSDQVLVHHNAKNRLPQDSTATNANTTSSGTLLLLPPLSQINNNDVHNLSNANVNNIPSPIKSSQVQLRLNIQQPQQKEQQQQNMLYSTGRSTDNIQKNIYTTNVPTIITTATTTTTTTPGTDIITTKRTKKLKKNKNIPSDCASSNITQLLVQSKEEGKEEKNLQVTKNINANIVGTVSKKLKKKRSNLPKEKVAILNNWLIQNLHNPYPSTQEKVRLRQETGLNSVQLSNWFINVRRRKVFQEYYNITKQRNPRGNANGSVRDIDLAYNPNGNSTSDVNDNNINTGNNHALLNPEDQLDPDYIDKTFSNAPLTRRKKLIDRLQELKKLSNMHSALEE